MTAARTRQADSAGPGTIDERTIVFTSYYPPAFRAGGPIRTLDALTNAAPTSWNIAVVTGDRDINSDIRLPVRRNEWTSRRGVDCYYVSARSLAALIRLWVRIAQQKPTVLYFNSFFSITFSLVPRSLHLLGWCSHAQVLLAPRGEFSPGALAIRSKRKQAYLALYKRLGLSRNIVWHASTTMEADHIRSVLGSSTRVLVRENETSLPNAAARAPELPSAHPLRIIFLSRLSPKKGLDVLLEALALTSQRMSVDVYGPEEDPAFVDMCRNLVAKIPSACRVTFCGEVEGDSVTTVLLAYDLLTLPTAGENFGQVIAESLSASCPVMCTAETPWTERLRAGGGVVVNSRKPSAWAQAIDQYASASRKDWFERRAAAGTVYNEWLGEAKGPHILDLLRHAPARGGTE